MPLQQIGQQAHIGRRSRGDHDLATVTVISGQLVLSGDGCVPPHNESPCRSLPGRCRLCACPTWKVPALPSGVFSRWNCPDTHRYRRRHHWSIRWRVPHNPRPACNYRKVCCHDRRCRWCRWRTTCACPYRVRTEGQDCRWCCRSPASLARCVRGCKSGRCRCRHDADFGILGSGTRQNAAGVVRIFIAISRMPDTGAGAAGMDTPVVREWFDAGTRSCESCWYSMAVEPVKHAIVDYHGVAGRRRVGDVLDFAATAVMAGSCWTMRCLRGLSWCPSPDTPGCEPLWRRSRKCPALAVTVR